MISSPGQRWSESFADSSGDAFAEIVSPEVELDGSIFARPVHGHHAVWTILGTASSIYDSIAFTNEAAAQDRVYLEWNATALGMRIDGVTVLVLGDHGQFTRIAIHHRPFAAVLAFSSEMARRLATGPGADHFYQAP
jgi:hypothetical protein